MKTRLTVSEFNYCPTGWCEMLADSGDWMLEYV